MFSYLAANKEYISSFRCSYGFIGSMTSLEKIGEMVRVG
jgi:hypothetical protein